MTERMHCPTDEALVGYLRGDLAGTEQRSIDEHCGRCDRCIETLRTVHARLRRTVDPLEPVPATVVARARAAPAVAAGEPSRVDVAQTPQRAAATTPVPFLLRLPVLIPMSLAAGMLLVVAVQTWLVPAPSPSHMRAVQIQRTVQAAVARAQPRAEAAVIMTLAGGELVEIREEQRGWCRVALPNGGEGWIERSAFE